MTVVNGVNDLGQLVGFYLDANGNTDGMLAAIPGTIATIANPTEGSTIRMPTGYGGVVLQGTNDVSLTDGGNGNALLQGNHGNDTISTTGSSDTVISGGNATVFGGTNELLFGSTGSLLFVGGGAGTSSTVVGGSGNETLFGGAGSGLFFVGGGSFLLVNQGGSDTVVAGAGASSVAMFCGSGGHVHLYSSTDGNVLVAGAGNETLYAAGTTGTTTLWAGAGNDSFEGGSGSDIFAFVKSVAHGVDTVDGWAAKDTLALIGYGSGGIVNQAKRRRQRADHAERRHDDQLYGRVPDTQFPNFPDLNRADGRRRSKETDGAIKWLPPGVGLDSESVAAFVRHRLRTLATPPHSA